MRATLARASAGVSPWQATLFVEGQLIVRAWWCRQPRCGADFEQIGLMPEPVRTSGNQRRCDRRHLEWLAFIRPSMAKPMFCFTSFGLSCPMLD
jgi:hypothetical protein